MASLGGAATGSVAMIVRAFLPVLGLAFGGFIATTGVLAVTSLPSFRTQWDWSGSQRSGVSSRTAAALGELGSGVRLTMFLYPDERRLRDNGSAVYPKAFNRLRSLAESARIRSNADVEVHIHDGASSLVAAAAAEERLGRLPGQVAFLESQGRKTSLRFRELFLVSEAGGQGRPARILKERVDTALGDAALLLTARAAPHALFLGGAGQGGIDDSEGLGPLAQIFRAEGWEVSWVESVAGDDSADLLVVAGQTQVMFPQEEARIRSWVEQGRNVLLGLGPAADVSISAFWNEVLSPLGVSFGEGIVCEPVRSVAGAVEGSPLCSTLEVASEQLSANHPVTRAFQSARRGLVVPGCRPVAVGGGSNRYSRERLARSHSVAWVESGAPPDFSRGLHESGGIVPLMAAAELLSPPEGARPGKAIIVGSGLMLRGRGAILARDFLASSLRWFRGGSMGEDGLLAVEHRPWKPNPTQRLRIMNLSILALPGSAFVFAFLAWWRRRR